MTRTPRAHYNDYVGNVTLVNYRKAAREKVVWEKDKKYSEAQIAGMLNDAYRLGRQHATEDVETALVEIKR